MGQLIEVNDPAGKTSYSYRPDGEIEMITTIDNIKTSFGYDEYGRQTSLNDPNAGVQSYTYDANGNIEKTINANEKAVISKFDELNRLKTKILDNDIFTYNYDLCGRIVSVTSNSGLKREYIYGKDNQLQKSIESIDDNHLIVEYGYSNKGILNSAKYSSGSEHIITENYIYTNGYLTMVNTDKNQVIWKLEEEDPNSGKLYKASTGNFTRIYEYDKYGYPSKRQTSYGDVIKSDFHYQFDYKTGNLLLRKDAQNKIEERFTYDNLNRLISATSNHVNHSLSYDNRGNIKSNSLIGEYEYSSQKPNAVSAINFHNQFQGNTADESIKYNSIDRPIMIKNPQATAFFKYDDNGDRIQMDININSSSSIVRTYFGSKYEIEPTTRYFTEKIYLHGDAYNAPAVYAKRGGQWEIYYITRDYLGSINQVIDKNGYVLEDRRYDAWGRLCNPKTGEAYSPEDLPNLILGRGYTGHEHLPWLNGLINMNARLYDPFIGRFLSTDPYVQMPDFSQSFNRYTYALNNPLKYTDPNGEFIVAAIFAGYMNWMMNGAQLNAKGLGHFGVGALSAAISAGVGSGINSAIVGGNFGAGFLGSSTALTSTGAFSGMASGFGSGFSSGFITSLGNGLINGDSFGKALWSGTKNGLIAGGINGVLGGISGGLDAVSDGRDFWSGSYKQYDLQPTLLASTDHYISGYNLPDDATIVNSDQYRVYYKPEKGDYGIKDYVEPGKYLKRPIDGVATSKHSDMVYKVPDDGTVYIYHGGSVGLQMTAKPYYKTKAAQALTTVGSVIPGLGINKYEYGWLPIEKLDKNWRMLFNNALKIK